MSRAVIGAVVIVLLMLGAGCEQDQRVLQRLGGLAESATVDANKYLGEVGAAHHLLTQQREAVNAAGAAALSGDPAAVPELERAVRDLEETVQKSRAITAPPCMRNAQRTVQRAAGQWQRALDDLLRAMPALLREGPTRVAVIEQVRIKMEQGDAIWAEAVAAMERTACPPAAAPSVAGGIRRSARARAERRVGHLGAESRHRLILRSTV